MKELKKKVIVIEETPLGSNIFESIAEEYKEIGKTEFHRRKNINKKTVFFLSNKWSEKMSVVHYPDNDFLNVFISGGHHLSKFMLDMDRTKLLIKSLVEYYDKLRSARKKFYKYDKMTRRWMKRESKESSRFSMYRKSKISSMS